MVHAHSHAARAHSHVVCPDCRVACAHLAHLQVAAEGVPGAAAQDYSDGGHGGAAGAGAAAAGALCAHVCLFVCVHMCVVGVGQGAKQAQALQQQGH